MSFTPYSPDSIQSMFFRTYNVKPYVYDPTTYSIMEMLGQGLEKINEVIKETNDMSQALLIFENYVLNQLQSYNQKIIDEVTKIINEKIQDGTLQDFLSSLFTPLNQKINSIDDEIEQINNNIKDINYRKPSATLTIQPTNLLYNVGESINSVVLNFNIQKGSNSLSKAEIYKNDNLIATMSNIIEGDNTYVDGSIITFDTSYKVVIYDDKSSYSTEDIKIKFVNSFYYGIANNDTTINESFILGLNKIKSDKQNINKFFNCNNQKIIFAYPSSYDELNMIYTNLDEDLESFIKTELLVNGVNYLVYESNNFIQENNLNIVFSFDGENTSNYDMAIDDLYGITNDLTNLKADKKYVDSINIQISEKVNQSELDSTNANVTLNTNDISNIKSQVLNLASGAPKAVSLASQMTDITKNYVYTGSENGYISGNWYYYNGSTWVSGGVYQATSISDKSVLRSKLYDFINGKNLIDSDKFTTGLLGANGIPYATGTYTTTDFISILPNTNYILSGSGGGNVYCYYDSNKTLIDSRVILNGNLLSGVLINISNPTAKYIRISLDLNYSDFQFEQGSSKTSYTPYYWKLNKLQLQEILEARGSYNSLKDRLDSINNFDLSKFKNAYIKNCAFVCNQASGSVTAKYAGVDFDNNTDITEMRAKAIFNPGSDGATIALINNAEGCNTIDQIVAGSLHVVFTDTKLSIGLYQNKLNNVVYSYTYNTPCLKDGITEYQFGWYIDKSTNTITLFTPDGYKTYTDNGAMVALMGQYCILEHYFNSGVVCPNITWFFVGSGLSTAIKTLLEDDFTRPDGALGVAPTGNLYHLYHEVN
jgi:hypothetical protein